MTHQVQQSNSIVGKGIVTVLKFQEYGMRYQGRERKREKEEEEEKERERGRGRERERKKES